MRGVKDAKNRGGLITEDMLISRPGVWKAEEAFLVRIDYIQFDQ